MYNVSLKRKWDNKAVLDYAIQKGLEEGLEKGLERGKEIEVQNLIEKLNLSDAQVSGVAGVSVAFVKKVRAALKKKG